ncbi:hypothetical protein [Sphingomonas mucosissima]|uniref:Uncharacterized protein n=1 Tax=Sphingomonas mucosissima TaxID=370959 RepID=A0A245ZF01_9SPHN|nr:hypothetical protein [Sphingomonas mucosissima]OWK28308.1 hypothetical protein SPMU_31640 [Sphingomonas mucosissima]
MIAFARAMTGLIGWAVAFSVLYGLQGLVCSPRLAPLVGPLPYNGRELIIGAWLLFLTILAWASWAIWRRQQNGTLLDWLARILALTGLASLLFTGFPVVFATTCA